MLNNIFENIQRSGVKTLVCNNAVFKEYWTQYVEKNKENTPIDYSYENFEYQNAYFSELPGFENLSTILIFKNEPIAIWPIFKLCERYTMYGAELRMPLFSKDITTKVEEQLSNIILKGIADLILSNTPITWRFNMDSSYISSVLSMSFYCKVQPIIGYEQIVDLEYSLDTLFAQLRKSYKSLINQTKQLFTIEVYTRVGDELWEDFKLFHFKQAGKATRAAVTWDIQKQQINNKRAILITIKEKNGCCLGYALFNFNAFEAIYAVAAYDRNKFNLPIAHGIQWEAINYFKNKGLKRYIIGTLPNPTESDTKQLNIAKFKMGFGSTRGYIIIKPQNQFKGEHHCDTRELSTQRV